jgi:hypothetical protein
MPTGEFNIPPRSAWQIDGHVARLESDELRAEVDLRSPTSGLKILAAAGAIVNGATLFRVKLPHSARDAVVDFFVRGNDLVATNSETAAHPFRAQIYLRFVPTAITQSSGGSSDRAASAVAAGLPFGSEPQGRRPTEPLTQSSGRSPDRATQSFAALELILSIQTNLLDADPTLTVESDLAAVQASQLVDATTGRSNDLPITNSPAVLGPANGLGCFHFRLADSPLACTEMVHPADFHRSTLERRADESNALRLSHQLFAQHLEKGVILRSRIRAIFKSCEADPALVARAYQDFAASDPPLTA